VPPVIVRLPRTVRSPLVIETRPPPAIPVEMMFRFVICSEAGMPSPVEWSVRFHAPVENTLTVALLANPVGGVLDYGVDCRAHAIADVERSGNPIHLIESVNSKMPALTMVVPRYVFAPPCRNKVFNPFLVSPPPPLRPPLMVTRPVATVLIVSRLPAFIDWT